MGSRQSHCRHGSSSSAAPLPPQAGRLHLLAAAALRRTAADVVSAASQLHSLTVPPFISSGERHAPYCPCLPPRSWRLYGRNGRTNDATVKTFRPDVSLFAKPNMNVVGEPVVDIRRRVLVVDDNRDAADSLALLLRTWGYDVRAEYDGQTAFQTMRSFRPDCVISDIEMPGTDGYRLAEMVRGDESLKNTTVIALSGNYDPDVAAARGFHYSLSKPAPVPVLETLLRKVLTMNERLKSAEEMMQNQGAVVGEVRELMKEVKGDVKELKEELREVIEDVAEIKQELRERDENAP
jgi:two-component system, OmpR family, response regulator